MEIETTTCSEALGVEVRNLNLSEPLSRITIDRLQRIWTKSLVMIFRNQNLSNDDLIRISNHFGECQKAPIGDVELKNNIPPEITVVSNVEENSKPIGFLGTGELSWHTDMSYNAEPSNASSLYAIEVTKDAGGETSYLNMYSAYDALPTKLLDRIKDKTAVHDSSYTSADGLRTGFKKVIDVTKAPGARHRMLRTHPITGRTALFLGRRKNAYILGLPINESEKLLDEIWAHSLQERFIYMHRWRQGDLVFWDNRCVMHRREAFNDKERRIMHRTQLKGEIPYYSG